MHCCFAAAARCCIILFTLVIWDQHPSVSEYSCCFFRLVLLMSVNAALLYKLWSLESHTTIQLLSRQHHYHSHTGLYHKRIIRQVFMCIHSLQLYTHCRSQHFRFVDDVWCYTTSVDWLTGWLAAFIVSVACSRFSGSTDRTYQPLSPLCSYRADWIMHHVHRTQTIDFLAEFRLLDKSSRCSI